MVKNLRIMMLCITLFLVSGCSSQTKNVILEGKAVEVEIADSDAEKIRGLMFRQSLDDDKGMLFVYESAETRTFWMKNTPIPLDIIFISPEKKIVDIQTMQPCEKEPCAKYTSAGKVQYALEVNAGFADENNISIGDKARW